MQLSTFQGSHAHAHARGLISHFVIINISSCLLIVKQLMGEKVGITEQTASLRSGVRGQGSEWAAKPQRGDGTVRLVPLVPSPDVQNRTSPVESGASGFTPSTENLRVQRLAVNTVLTVNTENTPGALEGKQEVRVGSALMNYLPPRLLLFYDFFFFFYTLAEKNKQLAPISQTDMEEGVKQASRSHCKTISPPSGHSFCSVSSHLRI